MSALRKGWCPGALRPMDARAGMLVRLRPSGGILPAATAREIAGLAERFGNGLFDLTSRANVQIRGVSAATLPALQDGLQTLGLLDSDADTEAVRNIVASPLAGLHGGIDIRPIVAALERRLAEDKTLRALPGKFGFLIDDGSRPSLADVEADVRFDWDGKCFEIWLGGTSETAAWGGQCDGAQLDNEAARIAKIFLQLAHGRSNVRRMRDLTAAVSVDDIAYSFTHGPSPACGRRRWPRYEPKSNESYSQLVSDTARDVVSHPTLSNVRVAKSRIRKQDNIRDIVGLRDIGNVRYLGLAAPFGRIDATMLRAAIEIAGGTTHRELRLTAWRTILIPGTNATALPGFITDPVDPRLSVSACVGVSGCVHGTTDTHADAAALATSLSAESRVALHISGCEKGCAKASPTPVTLIARNGRYDLVRNGRAGELPVERGLDFAAARCAITRELQRA